jgi:hypothetical protein
MKQCKATGKAHEWTTLRHNGSIKVCVWCKAFKLTGTPIVANN